MSTVKTAAVNITSKAIEELNEHPRNEEIRHHPEEGSPEWETLKESLEFDYFDPVVWNQRNGFLVSGHLRTKILASLGYTHLDAVVVDYDEDTHLARLAAANKQIGTENKAGMQKFFKELETDGINPHLTNFTSPQIDKFTSKAPIEEFSREEDEQEGEHNSPEASELRYNQLIYKQSDHEEYTQRLEKYRKEHRDEALEEFGTEELSSAHTLLYMLRQLASA